MSMVKPISNIIFTDSGEIRSQIFRVQDFDMDNAIYEVVRLIDGVPLFVEDHYYRLKSSAILMGYFLDIDLKTFCSLMRNLGLQNGIRNGNIKFVYYSQNGSNRWAIYFIPHKYPTVNEYERGVICSLQELERKSPGAKVIRHDIREKTNIVLKDKNIYEVILVDDSGFITEGSRSNVFFIQNDTFFTPPAQKVLEGITRREVIQCLNKLSFSIQEKEIEASSLGQYETVFITGTSPKVLPVNRIDNVSFKVNNLNLIRLMESYNRRVEDYITANR